MVLRNIADIIGSMGKDIRAYGLPDLDESGNSFIHRALFKLIKLYGILLYILNIGSVISEWLLQS